MPLKSCRVLKRTDMIFFLVRNTYELFPEARTFTNKSKNNQTNNKQNKTKQNKNKLNNNNKKKNTHTRRHTIRTNKLEMKNKQKIPVSMLKL